MIKRAAFLLVAGFATAAFAADYSEDQQLIDQAAARPAAAKPAPAEAAPAQPRPAADVQSAELEVVFARAKLDLALARRALQEGDARTAGARAQSALRALNGLPAELGAETYALQAEGVLARAARLGGDGAGPTLGDAAATGPAADPDADPHAYSPSDRLMRVDELNRRDEQRFQRDRGISETAGETDVEHLLDARESRIAPTGVVTYPPNWPEINAKRAQYRDGAIAKSSAWRDKDGREWYVAVYDIADICYVPPNASAMSWLDPRFGVREALDRDALRNYSYIFRGTAEDLAAGLPLLRYFGGIDEFENPRFSYERQQEVVEMIRAFTGARGDTPSVGVPQPVPPPQPAP